MENRFKDSTLVDDFVYSDERHIKYLSFGRREFERRFRDKFRVVDDSFIDIWMGVNSEGIRLSSEGFEYGGSEGISFDGFDPRLALGAGWVYVRPFRSLEFLISVDFLDRMFVLGGLP